jgi:sigma-B regulation protein RsbU (phosphoserine phosphatase)
MASEGTTSDPITWQEKLEVIVDMMQDMSRQTDPQAMVRSYDEKIQQLLAVDRRMSLNRRCLDAPCYRITRSTT